MILAIVVALLLIVIVQEALNMSTLADVDTAIQGLSAAISKFSDDFDAAIAALQAKIGAGQDTSTEVANLAALSTSIDALDAKAQAITTPAPAPTPAPTPTPPAA